MDRAVIHAHRLERRLTVAIQNARHTNGLSRCFPQFGDARVTITLSEPWKGVWAIDVRYTDPVRLGIAREQLQRFHPDARIRIWMRSETGGNWREVLPRKNRRKQVLCV